MSRLCILPNFRGEDRGDGGIRRVVEAQTRWLPTTGWDLVEDPAQADIVATHAGVQADVPATVPLVNHCHGLYWYGFSWANWSLKMNRDVIKAMRRADVVTSPSKWVAHAIARGTNIDSPVFYHGIEPEDWPEPDYSGRYVLWNKTRVDPICDPRDMLTLAHGAPDVQFVTTLFWSRDEAPAPNIEVTGVLGPDRAKELVRNAGVYLCTTRETFGIGTIEAMAAGVPILGWDWGGQAEFVDHRENGWLATPGDASSLLEGLRYCLENRERLGRNGREKVLRDFRWQDAIERYSLLYCSLLDRPTSPRVSVVIPAYNMESYLPDAVRSVLEQDSDDIEIIIVDDASTDRTPEIADNASALSGIQSDATIRVIHNTKNQYLAEALNIGIAAAKGRYIVPLDADNMLSVGSLKLLADSLDADRDIDIAYGKMSVIEVAEGGREWISDWPGEFQYRAQMKHHNQIPSTSMYRRRIWERVGGYRRRCRTAEDADFWCRATSFGGNARKVTDAVVLRYRNRPDSMSHVEKDWDWTAWYPWSRTRDLTPWIAPVDHEREHPTIPMHEFCIVSVIIPVGPGHERLVLDALDSIRAQTFIWWEVIVVNDTGRSLPWHPSWARVVDTGPTPRGAGYARNLGMSVANGRLFTFLDADDYLQPEALDLMVTEQNRSGGFVYSDWYKQETGEIYTAPEWDGCSSVLRQLPWPVTCLYPSAVRDVCKFDTTLEAWEDWDFAIQVVESGYCGTRVAVPLFHYRIQSGQRREAGVSNQEGLKQRIYDRWKHYISGDKQMPCGCSGGGGLPSLPAFDIYQQSLAANVPVEAKNEGATLLEYVGDAAAPITYSGSVTGTRYKFGADEDHRIRWVYDKDVPRFLEFSEFRPYNGADASPALVAAGPPR